MDEKKPEDKKADGLAKKGQAKYRDQVRAGLISDPVTLAEIQRDEKAADAAAKKPKDKK